MYGLKDSIHNLEAEISAKDEFIRKLQAEISLLKECLGASGTELYTYKKKIVEISTVDATINTVCKPILSWKFETGESTILVANGENITNNVYLPMTPYEATSAIQDMVSQVLKLKKLTIRSNQYVGSVKQ